VLALVTSSAARALDSDLPLLLAELPEATIVTWDDHTVDWSSFGAVVLRSTWDYHAHLDRFLGWARSVAAVTALWNPPGLIEWNIDKRYLLDLAARGIPIVPTQFVAAGDELPPCQGDIVVKPAVGAGSFGVHRFGDDPIGAHDHIDALRSRGAVAMVQEYQSAIDDHGETGLVFVGGTFSHAFRKDPILASTVEWETVDGQAGMFAREQTAATVPSPEERTLGELIVAGLPATAYARVDLLPTDDGPVLLELEVVEPSLFLHLDAAAPARAAAVFRNLVL
jgi:glutathione synthase/RimK-type ligase-like ATP-grasp enzyme